MRIWSWIGASLGATAILLACACGEGESTPPTSTETPGSGVPAPVVTPSPADYRTPTPGATATPQRVQEALRLVPPGWAVEDWTASQDQRYVVLTMTGPVRTPRARASVVSVYQTSDDGLAEVARWAAIGYGSFEPPHLAEGEDVLKPDELGTRRLSLQFSYPRELPSSASLAIESSGGVTISQDLGERSKYRTPVAVGTEAADPLALTSVTPAPWYAATPGPSLTVPAGTVPTGWTVRQAVWSSNHEYLAVVTDGYLNPWPVNQLSIYDMKQRRFRELWREVNFYVSVDEALSFRDINGDGTLDVVYQTSDGSNGWTLSPTLALTLKEQGIAEDLVFSLPIEASSPSSPVDLNGDGIYEWVAVDASWEAICFCHACSPASIFVLAWDGHEYIDATDRYAEAVDENRLKWSGQLDPVPPSSDASRDANDKYLSESVGRYLDYWNSGRSTDADRILQALREYQSFGELSAKRDWIAAALARDPHDLTGSYDLLGECPMPQG